MTGVAHLRHLARRFLASWSSAPPDRIDEAWAEAKLLPHEVELWSQLSAADRRHSIAVARRFEAAAPDADRESMAGALLHDVGKLDSGLGTLGRVVATVVGPRSDRFRRYHDHERIGAEWLAAAGSHPRTVELVHGRGPLAATLRAADDL